MFASSMWQNIQRAIPSITAMLASGKQACPICGAPNDIKQPGRFAALCRVCFRSIPWITAIHCSGCGRPEFCPDCRRRSNPAIVANRSAVRYDDTIREWLALYKYRGNEALEPLLGEMLVMAYRGLCRELSHPHAGSRGAERYPSLKSRTANARNKSLPTSRHPTSRAEMNQQPAYLPQAIIPVPVSDSRFMERGFNQAERLGSCLSAAQHIPLHDVLLRTGHSDKQSYKSRGARLRDTRNLFGADTQAVEEMAHMLLNHHPRPNSPAIPCRLLLIDDIYTTGSTANACAGVLRQAMRTALPETPLEIYCLTLARS